MYKRIKIGTQTDICISTFIPALFTLAKRWKQLKWLSRDKWINKLCYIYIYVQWNVIQP